MLALSLWACKPQSTTVPKCSHTELLAWLWSLSLETSTEWYHWVESKIWGFYWTRTKSHVLIKKMAFWPWNIRNPQFITILSEGYGKWISVIYPFWPLTYRTPGEWMRSRWGHWLLRLFIQLCDQSTSDPPNRINRIHSPGVLLTDHR